MSTLQDPVPEVIVRPARVTDAPRIKALIDIYAPEILLEKTLVNIYEGLTEFWVAETEGLVVGCGAVHVLWADLAELRTLATDPAYRGAASAGRCPAVSRRRPRGWG